MVNQIFLLNFLDQVEDNKEGLNQTQINQISRINRSESVIIGNNLNGPNEVSSKPFFLFLINLIRISQESWIIIQNFRYIQQKCDSRSKQWNSGATKTN